MRRLRVADAALLATLLPLWVAAAVLHVKQVATGHLAWVPVYVSAAGGGDDLPTVRGFWPGTDPDSKLAVGDRLLRAGTIDLRGVGPLGFVARVYEAAAAARGLQVPLAYERNGVAADTVMTLIPVAFPWRILPVAAGLVITGALVLARQPRMRVARAFFLLAIAYGLHWTFFFGGPRAQTYAWAAVFFAASLVMLPLILRTIMIFPPEVAPASGRLPWWPWLFAAFGPISLSWTFGFFLPPAVGFRLVFLVNVLFIATLLAILTRNYRRASPIGRRQLKWVVLGIYFGTVPVLLTDVVSAVAPPLWWLHEVAVIAELCIPVCVLMAIMRANYFDVDHLITGTAVYSFLSVALLASMLVVVPQVSRLASAAVDLDPRTGQLVLSIVFAAGLIPGQRYLRPQMERVLFRERHALKGGVEDLLHEMSSASAPDELLTLAGERLNALVTPLACVIYAPLGDVFTPVFARGTERHGGPPLLEGGAAVIDALRRRNSPLDLEQWAAPRGAELGPAERAALERLRAAVLIPVQRGDTLAAVISLAPKWSGDVYTSTDLALLGAVGDKLSGELLRFDTAEILRQERAMGEALRRYVPEPVAARLSRGQAIEGGEREVSVLFVDIRGYTTYSEQQAVDAVFSAINRYTETVSGVIQRRGGTVVEFLGDGLMAVFGAPDPLPEHARVAVSAACEIVHAVRDLAIEGAGGGPPIAVGVGIATGQAFVGNIQTSDRLVYTAVGDVVNLASRIQGLTRELGASVAVDASTHALAGAAAEDFERHEQVAIRGRSERVDVYALPLGG